MSVTAVDRALLEHGAAAFAAPVAHLDRAQPLDLPSIHPELRGRLDALVATVAGGGRGMLLVKGDPGQGKTHALVWLRRHAVGSVRVLDIPPLKDAAGLFAHLVRHTAAGLLAESALAPSLWRALLGATRALAADKRLQGDDAAADELDSVLPADDRFIGAFRALVQGSPAVQRLVAHSRRAAPLAQLDPDSARAITRLADPEVEPLVFDWLSGAELADADLASLGLRAAPSSEAAAFTLLTTLVRLADRPLLLAFDQLETVTGLLGAAAMTPLFTGLMELYQQLPVGIVLMCQTSVWGELRPALPQAALERIDELPPLRLPSIDEAQQLIEGRLRPLWTRLDLTPPYPSYPFGRAWIEDYCRAVRPTLRRIVLDCAARLDDLRRRGEVAEPASPVPRATVAATAPPSAAEVLARAHAGFVADVAAGRLATTAPERQDRLRSAVSQLLGALAHAASSDGDVQVVDVDTPAKPKVGPRPPAVVHLSAASGLSRRLAFDVNGERNAYHTLERVRTRVLQGEADAGVVLREERLRLGDGARRTLDVARSLEPLGGVAYLEDDAAAALIAADLLLDAVAGHELASGGRVIERGEALAHLVASEPLVAALQPMLARAMAADPTRGRRRGTTSSRRS